MNLHIFQRTLFTKLYVPHTGHFAQRKGSGKQGTGIYPVRACRWLTAPRLCQKATVWTNPKPQFLYSRKKYPALLPELRPHGQKNNSPHPKAAIKFFIPTIFRVHFILNAKNANDNSPSAFRIPRSRSCLTPISCLTVPKGCSTIHFLWDEIALFCKMRIFFNGTGDRSHSLLNSDFFIIRST